MREIITPSSFPLDRIYIASFARNKIKNMIEPE